MLVRKRKQKSVSPCGPFSMKTILFNNLTKIKKNNLFIKECGRSSYDNNNDNNNKDINNI